MITDQERQGQTELLTSPEPNIKRTRLSRSLILAAAGAIIILISLAFPFYGLRISLHGFAGNIHLSYDVSITDLISNNIDDKAGVLRESWIGSALPILFMIIFASITLISVIYSLVKGEVITRLWWIGLLSLGCILINASYLGFMWNKGFIPAWGETINLRPSYGVIMASIGALLIVISHPMFHPNETTKNDIAIDIKCKDIDVDVTKAIN